MARSKYPVAGVYIIHNMQANKVYIGSTDDLKARRSDHRRFLRSNTSLHSKLQDSWNECGEEVFTFSDLEKCPDHTADELKQRELYWQLLYKAHHEDYGYNVQDPTTGKVMEGVSCNKPRHSDKSHTRGRIENPVVVINITTGEKQEYVNAGEVVRVIGCKRSKLDACMSYWVNRSESLRSWRGLLFIRKSVYDETVDYINYKRPRKQRAKKSVQLKVLKTASERNVKRCPIIAHNIGTGQEQGYTSIKECCIALGLLKAKVHKCISSKFMKYKHQGYYFKRAAIL